MADTNQISGGSGSDPTRCDECGSTIKESAYITADGQAFGACCGNDDSTPETECISIHDSPDEKPRNARYLMAKKSKSMAGANFGMAAVRDMKANSESEEKQTPHSQVKPSSSKPSKNSASDSDNKTATDRYVRISGDQPYYGIPVGDGLIRCKGCGKTRIAKAHGGHIGNRGEGGPGCPDER